MSIPFRYGTTRRADKFEIGDYNTLRMCQFLLGTAQHIDADDLLLKLVMCQFLLGTVQLFSSEEKSPLTIECQFLLGTVQHMTDMTNIYFIIVIVSIPFRYGTTGGAKYSDLLIGMEVSIPFRYGTT